MQRRQKLSGGTIMPGDCARRARKDCKESEDSKATISFLVYVPPYTTVEPLASEGSIETAGATQQLSKSYEHIDKGPR
jgi:hypothetical protein